MIEIVYKEEKQEAKGNESFFHLPKNIRQIGDCKGKQKIYVEDYVYTYLKKLSADAGTGKAAILLGQYNWADGTAYFFIRGAFEITSMEGDPGQLKFDEHVWKEAGDTIAQYFKDQNILGWFLSLPDNEGETEERILKTHLNHFGGNDKVLFRMEPEEKEEAFYIYDGNVLKKLGGFYIYYEKNEAMQNYMLDHGQNTKVEDTDKVADQAVSDFRKIVGQKKEEQKKKPGGRGLAYGITVCAAAAALAFGLNYMAKDAGNVSDQSAGTASGAVAANGNAAADIDESDIREEVLENEENSGGDRTDGQAIPEKEEEDSPAEEADKNEDNTGDDSETEGQMTEGQKTETPENGSAGGLQDSSEEEPDNGFANGVQKTEDTGKTEKEGTAETSVPVLMEYTVQKGDSLSRISEKYYGTMNRVKDICSLNGITSEDVIYAGQKILLPK